MRFTLTYRGPLRGSGSGIQHKHDVRRALHPQLGELWTRDPLARKAAKWLSPRTDPGDWDTSRAIRQVDGHSFAVLVQAELKLVAELDILLLRAESPGAIIQRADIDNRLKTLFDALRYPSNPQEIPVGPDDISMGPLYCLLEDDRLITRVSVDTDRLLAPASVDDVELVIRVQLRASSPTWASIELLY